MAKYRFRWNPTKQYHHKDEHDRVITIETSAESPMQASARILADLEYLLNLGNRFMDGQVKPVQKKTKRKTK